MCQAVRELMADSREEGRIEGRAEGNAESILFLLRDLGELSELLIQKVMGEKDGDRLNMWLKAAARAGSIQEFESCMG